jgi:hypothetical protein
MTDTNPLYNNLVQKILASYKKIDFRPNPQVYFNVERKECNPLVALVLAQHGIEPFLSMGKFFNDSSAHRKITKMFDWVWVEGFNDGFNMNEVKKTWETYPLHAAGHKVGTEVRRQLRAIYFRKPNPQ